MQEQNVLTVWFTERTLLGHKSYQTQDKTHMHTHTEHLWGHDHHLNLYPAKFYIQLSTVHRMKHVKFIYVDLNYKFVSEGFAICTA